MRKAPIGIGIIGAGFGAAVQLPGFLQIPGVRVVGVASRDRLRSEELARAHRLPRSFSSLEELIACEDIDLVSVATPPAAHAALVTAAIAAGKAVLCEKPFTLGALEARGLLGRARESGIIHAIDFEFRELPALQLLKRWLESGSIGSLQRAELQWVVGTWADPRRPWSWHCDHAQGGGVLGALGVHLFDIAEWLLGPVHALRAEAGIAITRRRDKTGAERPVTSEDHATIEMRGMNDLPVRIVLSNVDPSGKGLELDIRGDRGKLLLQSTSQMYGQGLRVLEESGSGGGKVLLEAEDTIEGIDTRIPPFSSFASRLAAAVRRREKAFSPSFIEGVRTQVIREAVLSSSGRWIEL